MASLACRYPSGVTANISTEFCSAIKTSKCSSSGSEICYLRLRYVDCLCCAEKILFGLPPTVTVVKDDDTILDAVRRNSLLPAASTQSGGAAAHYSGGMRASLSAPPPLITHTDATPQGSPNDGASTPRHRTAPPPLMRCPHSLNGDTTRHQVGRLHKILLPNISLNRLGL